MPRKVTKKTEAEVKSAVAAVSGLEVNRVVQQIGTLQVGVNETLANLSATITAKLGEVDQIDKAIAAKKENLQELYAIEEEALKLEDIKTQRETEAEEWQNEQVRREAETRENYKERKKLWDRELEEHDYEIAKRNARVAQEYASLIDANKRAEDIRQAEKARNWAEREAALKAQEQEVVTLRQEVAGIDARIKAEVDKNANILTNTIKRVHEQEMVLLKKDMETAAKLHQAEKASFAQTISSLTDQLDALKSQLATTRQEAKEVTFQALQAASDKMASAAVQRFADTQAQGGKTSK